MAVWSASDWDTVTDLYQCSFVDSSVLCPLSLYTRYHRYVLEQFSGSQPAFGTIFGTISEPWNNLPLKGFRKGFPFFRGFMEAIKNLIDNFLDNR